MWRGDISVWKISRLASQLPPGARVWQSLGDTEAWSTEAHLLALVAETLSWANYQRGMGKGAKPKPVPRPADIKAKTDEHTKKLLQAKEAERRMLAKAKESLNSP